MSQSLSRRSFLKCAGSGAVSLAAALLTGVSAAAAQPRVMGQPALLDGKAAVELLGYAPAPGLGGVLVYLSVENLSARTLPVACAHRQGSGREVFHREIHQHIAHFLRRGIAQQLHGSFAVQQGRFACKMRLLRRCRYAGEQRCRKADRTGAGTFQE